ncbi:unnamed protein product [Arabidopsis lyrata]|uniref:Predicted protein n=1 Tax=Arabidopsis lyrata subsp. lyrata TaxID=81972 RepID=D7LKE8_ARALL|nr:predicted protein [Arabidopsis lyrata subsp. lyrata]CAH8265083.1 unnamed protein product [Arabidopsis lyrata]
MWSSKRGGKNVSNASSSKEPSDHFIKKYGVTIFWDFENLTVDRNAEDLSQLKGNIEVALKTLDHRFFIHGKPKGFGKFKGANWREVIELQNTDAFDLQNVDTKTVPCDAGGCNMNVRDSETPLDDDPYARITDIADTLLATKIF